MPAPDLNDLDAYISAFGDSCAKGLVVFKAIVDAPDQGIFNGEVVTTQTTITYKTTAVALAHNDAVTVTEGFSAGSYKVEGPPRKLDDGAFSIADLKAA